MIASFILAIAVSYYIASIDIHAKNKKWVIIALSVVTFLIIKTNGSNYYEIFKATGKIENKIEKGLSIGGAEYLPSSIPSVDYLWKNPRELIYDKENIKITNKNITDNLVSFDIVNLSVKDSIIIPFTYYKGYEISCDGVGIEYTQSDNGFIKIDVDKQSTIKVSYIGTNIQIISNYLALLLIFIFIVYVSIKTLKCKKMSELAIQLMYYIVIAIVGIVMVASPRAFIGRAKFDENSLKAEKFIKITGIAIIVISVILSIVAIVTTK